jgi:hypothetical protein
VTDRNRGWLECCDGLFTNYVWKPEMLPRDAPHVFVGTDCFGRGTYLGGGRKTGEALLEAKNRGLSNAVFAPGWTVEKAESKHAEEEMWLGVVWKHVESVRMVPFEGSFEEMAGGLMAASNVWCRRRASKQLPWSRGGIMRIHVVESHIQDGPFFVRFTCAGQVKEFVGVAQGIRKVSWTFCVAALPAGCDALSVVVEDGGRDLKNWSGHYGTVLGVVEVEYSSTVWPLETGIACVYPGDVVRAPEWSHFCIGTGDAFYVEGKVWRDSSWTNLALQSRLSNIARTSADFLIEFSTLHAYWFGSSLHLAATNAAVQIPLYRVEVAKRTFRVIVMGTVTFFVNGVELTVDSDTQRNGQWHEVVYSVPADLCGVLSVSLTDLEAFVGFLSFSSALPLSVSSPSRVTRSFSSRNGWRHLVEWSDLAIDPAHSLLQVFRDDILVAQLLPSAKGSFCDECEESDPKYQIRIQ